MIDRGQRVVAFAGQVVGIEWSGPGARRVADLIVGSADGGGNVLPDVIFRLGGRDDPRQVTLFRGRDFLYRGASIGAAAHLLLQEALGSLVERSDGGLVIHAALLTRGEAGILIPGPTGSGKSMLAAWLALRGLVPLSDEAAYLPAGEAMLRPFMRPFCFKGGWAEALGLEVDGRAEVLWDRDVTVVSTAVFSAAPAPAGVVPRLVAFPRYEAGGPQAITGLTPARAAVRLMESVANARNLRDHGLAQVTALARSTEAWAVRYGSFDQLGPLLARIEALGGSGARRA